MKGHTALLLLTALFGLAACGGTAEDASDSSSDVENPGIPVEVMMLEPTLFEDVIELTGSVEAPEDATVGAEASGTITFLAPLGSFVGQGSTIAQVDPSIAQAAESAARAGVAQAEAGVRAAEAQKQAAVAQMELAQDQHDRQEPLYRDSILSALEFRGVQTQLASARAQVSQAEAAIAQAQGVLGQARAVLEQARTTLANTRVAAPFGGTIETHFIERGETVAPGMPVARIVSGGGYRIAAGIPERYATDIAVGTPVTILAGSDEEPLSGRVVFSGRAIDPANRTFPVEIALADPNSRLRPEMVVRLTVSRVVLEDVIAVPLNAITRDERGASLLVVAERDSALVAERRFVDVGPSSRGRAVISNGVRPGERIIVAGQNLLEEGDVVRIVDSREGDGVAVNASRASDG